MAFQSIFLTGASSGLGASLAEHYAGPGVQLYLTGRSDERLEAVRKVCSAKGATVEAKAINVADDAAMDAWCQQICEGEQGRSFPDLVIANAGISAGTRSGKKASRIASTREVFAVNVDGVVNTVSPFLEGMRKRGKGQIAIVSSIASFTGLPQSASYCASKAAVRVWGESLRRILKNKGVGVSVICPGFFASRITDQNTFSMPGFMSTEKATKIITKGIARNKARIIFPFWVSTAAWLPSVLPADWADWLVARIKL